MFDELPTLDGYSDILPNLFVMNWSRVNRYLLQNNNQRIEMANSKLQRRLEETIALAVEQE